MYKEYIIDKKKQKKYIRGNVRAHKSYRVIRFSAIMILDIFPLIDLLIFWLIGSGMNIIDWIAFSMLVGSVFFVPIGLVCMHNLYERPYCVRGVNRLEVYEDYLDYSFNDINDDVRYHNFWLWVYRIEYSKISNIEYDSIKHILYITGHAENIEYKDFRTMELSEKKRLGEYDEKTRFGIVLAFENNNEKEFVELLKQKAGFIY